MCIYDFVCEQRKEIARHTGLRYTVYKIYYIYYRYIVGESYSTPIYNQLHELTYNYVIKMERRLDGTSYRRSEYPPIVSI